MTLNDYIRSIPADVPAADVADVLRPVTASPVPLASLAPYLRKIGVMAALKAVAADASTQMQIRVGIDGFLDHLADQRQTNLDTTDPTIAGQVAAIVSALQTSEMMMPAQVDDVYAMGGGLPFAEITADDVTTARTRATRSDAVEALWALAVTAHAAANALHDQRNGKVADLRNDPTLPVPTALAELDGEDA